jgi:hypothetical protein
MPADFENTRLKWSYPLSFDADSDSTHSKYMDAQSCTSEQQELCKINSGCVKMERVAERSSWDFRIERCNKPMDFDVTDTQLHHFCDASESGYGTVSYIRLTSRGRPPHITLVMGKARVFRSQTPFSGVIVLLS